MPNNQKIPEGWSVKKLGDIATKISRKNTVQNTNVVTISAQKGFINQEQFFNKSVAGENLTTYYLLERGDFGYNRSYSKGYPTGAIKRLDNYDYAIASTLYICFTLNDIVDSDYVLQYFETGLQNVELYKIVQEGARNHGLLNIAISDFFNIKLVLPPLAEQEKIAGILGTWDEAIEKLSGLIEQKKLLKKGLMQKLLTGKTRLPGFTQPWKKFEFDTIFYIEKGVKNKQIQTKEYQRNGCFPVVDQGKELVVAYCDIKEKLYNDTPVIIFGDHTRILKFITFPFVIGADGTQLIKTYNKYSLTFCFYVLQNTHIANRGYSRHMSLLKEKVFTIPTDIAEQQAIADVLSTADDEINLLNQKLEALKEQKKGLMQQLLIGQIRVKVN